MKEHLKGKEGSKAILKIVLLDDTAPKNLLRYYWGFIIPQVQTALKDLGDLRSEKQIDFWLRGLSPVTQTVICTPKGLHYDDIIPVELLSKKDLLLHIEYIIKLSAEHLYLQIKKTNL